MSNGFFECMLAGYSWNYRTLFIAIRHVLWIVGIRLRDEERKENYAKNTEMLHWGSPLSNKFSGILEIMKKHMISDVASLVALLGLLETSTTKKMHVKSINTFHFSGFH